MNPPVSRLCAALGYVFRQPELLEEALTHRSISPRNNERLEFLGDALLNLIVAEWRSASKAASAASMPGLIAA